MFFCKSRVTLPLPCFWYFNWCFPITAWWIIKTCKMVYKIICALIPSYWARIIFDLFLLWSLYSSSKKPLVFPCVSLLLIFPRKYQTFCHFLWLALSGLPILPFIFPSATLTSYIFEGLSRCHCFRELLKWNIVPFSHSLHYSPHSDTHTPYTHRSPAELGVPVPVLWSSMILFIISISECTTLYHTFLFISLFSCPHWVFRENNYTFLIFESLIF